MSNTNNILWQDRKHFMWFPFSFTKYYIENDRLMIKEGLLSTTLNETLLYRIVDLTFHQTLLGKIFGTGDIIVKAKADSTPELVLKNIKNPMKVRNLISQAVEESRQHRNVVGKEFYADETSMPPHMHVDVDGDGDCDFDHDEP